MVHSGKRDDLDHTDLPVYFSWVCNGDFYHQLLGFGILFMKPDQKHNIVRPEILLL